MGAKVAKQSGNEVTKFTKEDLEESSDDGDYQSQRPPTGMPNPRDAPAKKNFLSVPAVIYVDDDSISTMSVETTTLFTKSSAESSTTNLTCIEGRRLSTSWHSSNDDIKSMTNLMPGITSLKVVRSISKEEKIKETGLDDIEESPNTSYVDDSSTPTNEDKLHDQREEQAEKPSKQMERLFTVTNKKIPPSAEKAPGDGTSQCQVHLIDVSDDSPKTQPSKIRDALKSPKTYFMDNIQRRREKSMIKSQSAHKFMSVGPNLLRRHPDTSSEKEDKDFEEKFTNIDKVNTEEANLAVKEEKKRIWSSSANRYRLDKQPMPSFNWAYNLQQRSRFRDFPSKSKSCYDIAGKK